MLVFTVISPSGSVSAYEPTKGEASLRSRLGLPTDRTSVARANDQGGIFLGIPMTQVEMVEAGRVLNTQATAIDSIAEPARRIVGFAGVYFDRDGGQLVVRALDLDAPGWSELGAAGAAIPRPGVRFEAAAYSFSQLEDGQRRLIDSWQRFDALPFVEIGIDVEVGGLRVVVQEESALNKADGGVFRELLGDIPVVLASGSLHRESACTSRDNCTSPMRGGIRIKKGSTSGATCTAGFHIRLGTDDQLITAGHCGYSGSNNWYHVGYGLVGAETATAYGPNGFDAMRVQMANAQSSNDQYSYSTSFSITSYRTPVDGEVITTNLGNSNAVRTGSVVDATVYSPADNKALGLVSTTSGRFARVVDVLPGWGAAMRP